MNYKLSQRSYDRLKGIDPILLDIITEGIKQSPFDFGIPMYGGYRTTAEQQKLYSKGRTSAGKKVTWVDGVNKKSYHQSGKAFDIYAYVDGKASWDKKYYEPIARHLQKVAKECYNIKLEWGGDWTKFKDLPHFQIK